LTSQTHTSGFFALRKIIAAKLPDLHEKPHSPNGKQNKRRYQVFIFHRKSDFAAKKTGNTRYI